VHEQRKKFVKSILQEDRFLLLVDNGFIFQPRQHEQQSMATLVQRHKGYFIYILLFYLFFCFPFLNYLFPCLFCIVAKQQRAQKVNVANSNDTDNKKRLMNNGMCFHVLPLFIFLYGETENLYTAI